MAELLLALEKASDLWVDGEKTFRSAEVKLSLTKHQRESFEDAMETVNKELSGGRVECAA